ncbi:MAG: 3-oxoacid CoA-transferase subunit B [Burkholderiaceae bacterium]
MSPSSTAYRPLSRTELAARAARDIPEGWYVNLGIGIPTLIADQIAQDKEVILHSENGVLGFGPAPQQAKDLDPWLINAGKQPVTLKPGASFVHHADSFAMIRGGHLDLCVLGAFEVSQHGDLANWATSDDEAAPAVGGAMDLAAGARQVWVLTEHTTRDGRSKLVEQCSYPLTALRAVSRVYTNLATLQIGADGFEVIDMVAGLDLPELQRLTAAPLRMAERVSA